MERLQRAGLAVVPITGRPAGWCDHIARMWPVYARRRRERRFLFPLRPTARARCSAATSTTTRRARATASGSQRSPSEILRRSPARRSPPTSATARPISRSTSARTCRALPRAAVERIAALMRARGLTAKVSSIHVNGWFGDLRQARHDEDASCANAFGVDLDAARARATCSSATRPTTRRCSRTSRTRSAWRTSGTSPGRLDHEPAYVTTARGRGGLLRGGRLPPGRALSRR